MMDRFTYSETDKDCISASLPNLINITNSIETGDWSTLLNLCKAKMRYSLHASSLNDYLKSNMIPQGLRIQKAPIMFKYNESFNF